MDCLITLRPVCVSWHTFNIPRTVLWQAVTRFVQLTDDSEDEPNLNKKSYSDFQISRNDWEWLDVIREVLCVCAYIFISHIFKKIGCRQEPANAQQTFSSSRNPTGWHAIPVLEFMQESWENMARHNQFKDITNAIEAGLANLQKWYCKVDDTNVYFICMGMSSHFV